MPSSSSSAKAAAGPSTSSGIKIKEDPEETIRRIKQGIEEMTGIKAEAEYSKPRPSPGGTSKDDPPKFELSDTQKKDIEEAFNTLDYEGTGFIKTTDLKVNTYFTYTFRNASLFFSLICRWTNY